jgi:hypothetical protein
MYSEVTVKQVSKLFRQPLVKLSIFMKKKTNFVVAAKFKKHMDMTRIKGRV